MQSLFIHWNPEPELFNLFGISIRYYGLLWVIGLALGYLVVRQVYRDKRIGDDKFEPLFFYCFIGILLGARLGHCLFYEPEYYLSHLTEMLLPIKFLPDGGWKFTGYQGLASHGGTWGLIIALWLYCRRTKMHYLDVVDIIAIATPICACCIRLANLMNSEIIGNVTNVPWAFVFERVDMQPRHPGQLYEAIAYFLFFLGMMYLYGRKRKELPESAKRAVRTDFSASSGKGNTPAGNAHTWLLGYPRGFFFGLCLTEIFTFRFFIEFLKENQVNFEEGMTFNMGQWLSVPFILVGIYFMCFYGRGKKK